MIRAANPVSNQENAMKSILVLAVAVACLSLVMQAGVANAQTRVSVEQAWHQ